MIPLGPVVARTRVNAPRAAVWSFLVERRGEWWSELQLDPGVGGTVSEHWSETSDGSAVSRDAEGAVDVWVEGHALGFTWRDAGDVFSTAVLLTLRSQGAETGITVTETGFDALPDGAARAAASQEGWQVLLGDLTEAIDASVAAGEIDVTPVDDVTVDDVTVESVVVEGDAVEETAVEGDDAGRTAEDERGGESVITSETALVPVIISEGELVDDADEAAGPNDTVEIDAVEIDKVEIDAVEIELVVDAEVVLEIEGGEAAEPDEPDFDELIGGAGERRVG